MDKALCSPHTGTNNNNPSPGSLSSSGGNTPAWRVGGGGRTPTATGSHSPGSASLGGSGRGSTTVVGNSMNLQQAAHAKRQLEGVLSKYTNLIQGWQNRYFVLDPELGQLQYFVNEQGKCQKPRGSLPLMGASVTQSDEAPHMFVVNSVNGELYKLRASDAKEQQFWINQLQACARRHSDSSAKVRKLKGSDEHLSVERIVQEGLGSSSSGGRTRSFSLLPHLPPSSSPGSQRHPAHQAVTPSNIVTITHHKSPAAGRRAKNQNQYPGRLLEVKEVMSQAEGQQKSLVQSIDSLPTRGPVSCLDHDLLLLKATSAATLSCLGECLNILQQSQSHHHHGGGAQSRNQSSQSSSQSQANHHHHHHNAHVGDASGESQPQVPQGGPAPPTLLLEPPTPSSPSSSSSPPLPLFSSSSSPPSPSPASAAVPGGGGEKGPLAELDCGPCPYLMGALNLNVCGKCC